MKGAGSSSRSHVELSRSKAVRDSHRLALLGSWLFLLSAHSSSFLAGSAAVRSDTRHKNVWLPPQCLSPNINSEFGIAHSGLMVLINPQLTHLKESSHRNSQVDSKINLEDKETKNEQREFWKNRRVEEGREEICLGR